jgi:ubiquitin-activating enzyme E1
VVAYTEILNNIDEMIEINEFVRSKNIGFILSQTYGPQGFTFLDYGHDFIINDVDGEETSSINVAILTQTNPCVVTVNLDKRHKFQDGDYVKFSEVLGMTELNSLPPTRI